MGAAGAGIGAGEGSIGDSRVGELVIDDSIIVAQSASSGAGIGAGLGNSGIAVVGSIAIRRSDVQAIAGSNAAGIGGGYAWNTNATVTNVSIVSSTIVTDSIGAGSRLGESRVSRCAVENSNIQTGSINAIAITLSGRLVLECTANDSHCISAASLALGGASIEAVAGTRTFIDPVAAGRTGLHPTDFYGQYRTDSQSESAWRHPLLHFARVNVGSLTACSLIFTGGRYTREVSFAAAAMRGLVIALPANETYKIEVRSNGDYAGKLCYGDALNFSVGAGELMLDSVGLCARGALSDGAITGIALGAIVAVAAIGIVFVLVFRKRPKRADYRSYVDSTPLPEVT
jgi:hypothetical protein